MSSARTVPFSPPFSVPSTMPKGKWRLLCCGETGDFTTGKAVSVVNYEAATANGYLFPDFWVHPSLCKKKEHHHRAYPKIFFYDGIIQAHLICCISEQFAMITVRQSCYISHCVSPHTFSVSYRKSEFTKIVPSSAPLIRSCICLEYPIFILSPSSIMSRMLYNIRDRISTGFAFLIYSISKQSAHNQTAAMSMHLRGIICPAPVEAMQ